MNLQTFLRVGAVLLVLSFGAKAALGQRDHRDQARAALGSKDRVLEAIAAKNKSAAITEAKALETVFRQMETYWQKRGSAPAVRFAKESATVARAAGKAVEGENLTKASQLAKGISIGCDSCHGVADSRQH